MFFARGSIPPVYVAALEQQGGRPRVDLTPQDIAKVAAGGWPYQLEMTEASGKKTPIAPRGRVLGSPPVGAFCGLDPRAAQRRGSANRGILKACPH